MSRCDLEKIIPYILLVYIYAPPAGAKLDGLSLRLRLIADLMGPEAFMKIVEQAVEEVASGGR